MLLPFSREMLELVERVTVRRCDGSLSLRVSPSAQQGHGLSDTRIDICTGDDRMLGFNSVLVSDLVARTIATLTSRTATRNLPLEESGEAWVWDID